MQQDLSKNSKTFVIYKKQGQKTSIRYAKENDREKKERRRERERKVEGEISRGHGFNLTP